MIKENLTIDEALDVLNDALKVDQEAITDLVRNRVRCNNELAKHPTIQVYKLKEDKNYKVGLLGILNGLFGASETGYGIISANFELSCPYKCEFDDSNLKMHDACPVCGELLALGKIKKFSKTPDEYLYKEKKQ